MPIFKLSSELVFPPAHLASENGIIAVGGDLSPERVLLAYRSGIFPWYSDEDPIIWWSPDPRFVLFPGEVYISKTMRQVLRRKIFTITYDRDFRGVISACRRSRRKQRGTWITEDMLEAYTGLHDLGYAHSVEAWQGDELAGGLYGISIGRCFFGESMFTRAANASKAALITLAGRLNDLGFVIIDSQVYTAHVESLGAREIPRAEYMEFLRNGLRHPTLLGNWGSMEEFSAGYGSVEDRNPAAP